MLEVAQRVRPARMLAYLCGSVALLTGLSATPAAAAVNESVTISNSFGHIFDSSTAPSVGPGGTKETIFLGNSTGGARSELGINYTGTADSSGFFFLHDNLCVGICGTYSETVITFTLSNAGDGTESLRFDSQITPGHMARIFGSRGMAAGFQFTVTEVKEGFDDNTLYSASGTVTSSGIDLDQGGLNYTGLKTTTGAGFEVLDWGATNLNLLLNPLRSGETTKVIYRATYMSRGTDQCANIFECSGVQVVFGDPRNNGGVIDAFADFGLGSDADPKIAVIGGDYQPFFVPARFVNADAPLPEQPGDFTAPNYNTLFVSRAAIPEPANWAMMILGFGAAGAAMRRRTQVSFA